MRIFELALRKANLTASDAWYIGDNAVCDIDGASECGMFAVWYKGALSTGNKCFPKRRCLEIKNWNELIQILSVKNI